MRWTITESRPIFGRGKFPVFFHFVLEFRFVSCKVRGMILRRESKIIHDVPPALFYLLPILWRRSENGFFVFETRKTRKFAGFWQSLLTFSCISAAAKLSLAAEAMLSAPGGACLPC
jgi:hypothetical protein